MGDKPEIPESPDYTPLINASIKVSERAQALAEQQFQWAQETYATNRGKTDGLVEDLLEQMSQGTATAQTVSEFRENYFTNALGRQVDSQGRVSYGQGRGLELGNYATDAVLGTVGGTRLSTDQQRALESRYTAAQINAMDSNERLTAANELTATSYAQAQLDRMDSVSRRAAEQEALASTMTAAQAAQLTDSERIRRGQQALLEQTTNNTRDQLNRQSGITVDQQGLQGELTAAQRSELQKNLAFADAERQQGYREFGRGETEYQEYQRTFKPIENRMAEEAMTWDSPARIAEESSRAVAGVGQQFEAARTNAANELQAYGVNPGAVRFGALDLGTRVAQAQAQAAAAEEARRATQATGREMRGQAAQLGQANVNRSMARTGAGLQAGQGARSQQQLTQAGAAANAGAIAQALDGLVKSGQLSSQVAQQIVQTTAQSGGQANTQLMQLMSNLQQGGQMSQAVRNQLMGLFQSGGTQAAGNAGAGIGLNQALGAYGYGTGAALQGFGLDTLGATYTQDQQQQNYANLISSILHGTTSSGASSMGTGVDWSNVGANAMGIWGNTMNTQFSNQMDRYNAQQAQSSGWGTALGMGLGITSKMFGFEGGGVVPDATTSYDAGGGVANTGGGGAPAGVVVPQSAGVTNGAIPDDVPARLTPGEFVVPADTVRWLGEKHFHNIIQRVQNERSEKPNLSGAVPAQRDALPQAPTFASPGTATPGAIPMY